MFLAGVFFGYFVIAPFAVTFLAGYELPGVVAQPSLGSYISYLVMLTVPVGLTFELPVAVHVLTRLGIVGSKMMKSYRKHALVVIIVLASIITPPDVFSQVLISSYRDEGQGGLPQGMGRGRERQGTGAS